MGVSITRGSPKWMVCKWRIPNMLVTEHPIEMDDLGVPLSSRNLHIGMIWIDQDHHSSQSCINRACNTCDLKMLKRLSSTATMAYNGSLNQANAGNTNLVKLKTLYNYCLQRWSMKLENVKKHLKKHLYPGIGFRFCPPPDFEWIRKKTSNHSWDDPVTCQAFAWLLLS